VGIVHKEFLLTGQTVNSEYYCDLLQLLRENVLRNCPELWRQEKWLLPHDKTLSHASFLTREFLTKINMTIVITHPPYFSVSLIEDKIERPPYCYNLGDGGRIAGVLNTLTEHGFQDAFTK
jgi:hypothetical protein